MRYWIIATITLSVSRIAYEHTRKRARGELMCSSGGDTRVATTAKNAEVIIRWWSTKQKMMWCILPARATGANVDEKSSGGEGIRPKTWGHVGMKQEGADAIIEGAKDAFSATVLLRSVGTRETENSAMSSKKSTDSEVVKFFAVISLKSMYGATKLCGDEGEKGF